MNGLLLKKKALLSNIKTARIPFEYQEVEYIEATNGQCYFEIDYTSQNNDIVELKTSLTSGTNEQAVFGYDGIGEVYYQNNAVNFWRGCTLVSVVPSTVTYDVPNTIRSQITNAHYLWNLLAYRSGSYIFQGKLFYCTIERNNTIIHNYIPCYRKSDNVIGVYDTFSDKFFTNKGTGTFVKGPDV